LKIKPSNKLPIQRARKKHQLNQWLAHWCGFGFAAAQHPFFFKAVADFCA
jgi:hypothetical protein